MLNDTSIRKNTNIEDLKTVKSQNHFSLKANKIHPIPITRRSLPNSSQVRTKLKIKGYKHFSKISASGSQTLLILKNIQKSVCLRMTPKFEFDPYFCDSSCLPELSLVLKKLKNIKDLSLIIRRLGHNGSKDNSIDIMGPNIYKLLRLKRIKIEFPNTSNLIEDHLFSINRTLCKCYLLKSYEWKITDCPTQTLKSYQKYLELMKKLRKLEYYKDYSTIQKGIPNSDLSFSQGFSNPPKIPRLRVLEILYGAAREWADMVEDGGSGAEAYGIYISRHPNLEKFKCTLIKNYLLYNEIIFFVKPLVSMVNLRYADFEFLNCRVDDQELLIIAYGLSLVSQLKYARFKFIQSSPLSIEGIEQFVDKISRMNNLENFDLYFRK